MTMNEIAVGIPLHRQTNIRGTCGHILQRVRSSGMIDWEPMTGFECWRCNTGRGGHSPPRGQAQVSLTL